MHIDSIHLQNFRLFKDLEIASLGRVNLISGVNNVGKSSLLDGLRIAASHGSIPALMEVMKQREEYQFGNVGEGRPLVPDPSGLFFGYPLLENHDALIQIRTAGNFASSVKVSLKRGATPNEVGVFRNSDQLRLFQDTGVVDVESGGDLYLLVQSETGSSRRGQAVSLSSGELASFQPTRSYYSRSPEKSPGLPCCFVSSSALGSSSRISQMWDMIALSPLEERLLDSLKIIDPDITAVAMVGSHSKDRIAMVKSARFQRPVPLRSYGDGMNRIFEMALTFINARNGLLLIDEFENGLHYTAQEDVWRFIFRISRELNVQVFATTHSWDSIEAFQQVAEESEENGILIRLSQFKGKIISTIFDESELAIVTRDRIEVR